MSKVTSSYIFFVQPTVTKKLNDSIYSENRNDKKCCFMYKQ